MRKLKKLLTMGLPILLVSCGNLSKVQSDGEIENPHWPKVNETTFIKQKGIFPNLKNLADVKSGTTKDQLYYLLGRPHYGEGLAGVREWTYLLHFYTPNQGTNGITTCQFKIGFDKERFARTFYWNPIDPENGVCPPIGQPVEQLAEQLAEKDFTLSGDALFKFNQYDYGGLYEPGKQELNRIITQLKQAKKLNSIFIEAYTDRLGSNAYNQSLSDKRALTVKNFFVKNGIPANLIIAEGKGKKSSIKQCDNKLSRSELHECLAPNRRIEIKVQGIF